MSGLKPVKPTPVPKKPDPNDKKYNTGLAINLGDRMYEADLAQYNDLRAKISEDIKAPTREEIANREPPKTFGSMSEALGYVNPEVGYRRAMREYENKVKEQDALRKQYPNWKEWAIDSDAAEPTEPTEPSKPTSTTRNNSILTGATGDTQANVQRQQLQDATRRRRKSLLGE